MMKKLLFILILCSNVAFGQETEIETLKDSIIQGDGISFISLYSDSIHITPSDTIPAYIMYINTESSNIYSPPHFIDAKFKNESTRKVYDSAVYWCNGYFVRCYYKVSFFLNESKKPFSDDIVVWDWREK